MNKKILDYIEFEKVDNKVLITETLEYYLKDLYTKKEFWKFIKKLTIIYNKLK